MMINKSQNVVSQKRRIRKIARKTLKKKTNKRCKEKKTKSQIEWSLPREFD